MDIKSAFRISAGVTGQQSIDKLSGSVGKVNANLARTKAVAKTAATAIATIAAVAVPALLAAAKGAIDYASGINDAAKAAGIGAETFQALAFNAKQAGVDGETFSAAMIRATKSIGDAANGTGTAAKLFDRLKINVNAAGGGIKSTEQIIRELSDKLQGMGSQAERSAAASALFGKAAGPQLAALLENGNKGLQQSIDRARELGVVISDELIEKADAAGDSLDAVADIVKAQLSVALIEAAPLIVDLAKGFVEAVSAVSSFYKESRQAIDYLGANEGVLSKFLDSLRGAREFAFPSLNDNIAAIQQGQEQFGTIIRPKGNQNILGNQGLARSLFEAADADQTRGTSTALSVAEQRRLAEEERKRTAEAARDARAAIAQAKRDASEDIEALREAFRIEDFRKSIAHDAQRGVEDIRQFLRGSANAISEEIRTIDVSGLFENVTEAIADTNAQIEENSARAAQNIAEGFERVVFAGFQDGTDGMLKAFENVLAEMVLELGRSALKNALADLFTANEKSSTGSSFISTIGSLFGGSSSGVLQKSGSASAAKFASGGSFTVPGPTSGDRVIPIFRANGGERVDVTPKGQGGNGQAITIVHNIDARGADPASEQRMRTEIRASEQRTIAAITDKVRRRRL